MMADTFLRIPILKKFLFCFELGTGGVLMGILDSLLYAVILVLFCLQIFFDIQLTDEKHSESYYLSRIKKLPFIYYVVNIFFF